MSDLDVVRIEPLSGRLDAVVRPPGSKSLTNRALVLAALAQGPSVLRGALRADDTDAMIGALRALGAHIAIEGTTLHVQPAALDSIAPGSRIDTRLSGTTSRFVLPLVALAGVPAVVDGDEPLRRRPMGPVLDGIRALGAVVEELGEPGHLPVRVTGGSLEATTVRVDASASSQFLSAMLLVAPRLRRGLEIVAGSEVAARPFVDLTIATLTDFGAQVTEPEPNHFVVTSGGLVGREYDIEPDATAATYFAAAAVITGGMVRLDGIGQASIQGDAAFLDVLAQMGAGVERSGNATVITGGRLQGVDVDLSACPDTAQTLAAVAVFAEGPTRVRGVGFIRGHETDRIEAVVTELNRLGVDASATDDGFVIVPGQVRPGTVATYDDHRMAMSFALIGLRVPGIAIADPGVVSKTFPDFFEVLDSLRHG